MADTFDYLKKNWDKDTTRIAAEKGHFYILRHLHQKDCPWDMRTLMGALKNNRFNCFKYAMENNCPFNQTIVFEASYLKNNRILQYLIDNGHTTPEWNEWVKKEN